ncbi:MAG: CocE/NonD family hydrolase [Coriobacteriales bacterium]|nr:CocE/NonD family hydrolase [Coriobacteriales bacterium]
MGREGSLASESLYVQMRDGTRIAVDVTRPAAPGAGTVPAVITATRYWRSFSLRTPGSPGGSPLGPRDPIGDFFVERGFAVVIADVRGTGASEGVWPHPWSNLEIDDLRDIVDWVVDQPWSNGRVGATGISYEGTTAMLLASLGHPAVKAVAARSFEYDVYADIVRPGGVLNEGMMRSWSESLTALDENKPPKLFGPGRLLIKGVRPVDDDPKAERLAAIVNARSNPPVFEAVAAITDRDDHYDEQEVTLDDLSVMSRLEDLRDASVPIQLWASWLDGTTARSALRFYDELPNVREVRIGAWSHTGAQHGSPLSHRGEPDPPLADQWVEIAAFLGPRLLEAFDGREITETERLVHYFTLGEEQWHSTPVWPPAHVHPVTWNLAGNGALATDSTDERVMRHVYDSSTGTGKSNRWYTQLAQPVRYGNRAHEDRRLATWDSAALVHGIEVTGSPRATLKVRANVTDLALFAYLEVIDLDGYVHYITEGQLRARHRGAGGRSTYLRADAASLGPEDVAEFSIELLPTSVYVPAGWHLRLAVATEDNANFESLNAGVTPEVEFLCGGGSGSILVLPTG